MCKHVTRLIAFWQTKVDAERLSPRQMWQSIDALLGRGRVLPNDSISAAKFNQFFDNKVAGVRAMTADIPPPLYVPAIPGCELLKFETLSVKDIVKAVRGLSDKQCASDPIPTSLLKDNIDVLALYIVELCNRSLSAGVVPSALKTAYITPVLKKSGFDSADLKSYRPISNLPILSKLLERLVARQLVGYLNGAKLLPQLQSAYRSCHSTESAVDKVLMDILHALDVGNLAMLGLLDLSATFDTVDHATLMRRLEISYGIRSTTLHWFASYLDSRYQYVRCGADKSTLTLVLCGVPQGSVLGPILFLLYKADIIQLIDSHGLHSHAYADDTQIYGSCRPAGAAQLQERVSSCIDDVALWMRSNRLQLNTAKTEVLWCASSRRQHQIPQVPVRVGSDLVSPASSVRDLGIHLDADASMKGHISMTVSNCFAILRQLRSIRRSVSRPVMQSLVVSLPVAGPHESGLRQRVACPAYRTLCSTGCSPCRTPPHA